MYLSTTHKYSECTSSTEFQYTYIIALSCSMNHKIMSTVETKNVSKSSHNLNTEADRKITVVHSSSQEKVKRDVKIVTLLSNNFNTS